jgi:hypothetical protein
MALLESRQLGAYHGMLLADGSGLSLQLFQLLALAFERLFTLSHTPPNWRIT